MLSQKGQLKFEYRGFLFNRAIDERNFSKGIVKWQCESRNKPNFCYATIYSNESGVIVRQTEVEHKNNHPADPNRVREMQDRLQKVSEEINKTPDEYIQKKFSQQRNYKSQSSNGLSLMCLQLFC